MQYKPIIFKQNHILYSSSNDIKQITKPLTDYFGITHFAYVRINPDLSRINLQTNVDWIEIFYQNVERYYQLNGLTEGRHWQSGYSLLELLDEQECLKDAKTFNIGQGIVIAEHADNLTELVYLALPVCDSKNAKLINLLNNIDLIKKFILYFKEQADPIIRQAIKTPIILPFLKQEMTINNFGIDVFPREAFLESIDKNFRLLSSRERQCIDLLLKGFTNKMTAKALNISPRTVESYLNEVKNKLGCTHKSQLVKKFLASKN